MIDAKTEGLLVVSADAALRQRVTEALRSAGLVAATEASGPAAAAKLALRDPGGTPGGPGLLVVDLGLPELDRQRLREALGDPNGVPDSLEVVERRQIAAMLHHTGGNRRRAAQLLGLARSTLLAKIRRYGLDSHLAAEV
jgi:CheY-like chemotaxis protein